MMLVEELDGMEAAAVDVEVDVAVVEITDSHSSGVSVGPRGALKNQNVHN